MTLSAQSATVFVTTDGEEVLKLVGVDLKEASSLSVFIEESEEMGLWVRLLREDQVHLFLLRWEYVLGIDLPSGLGKVVGLKG